MGTVNIPEPGRDVANKGDLGDINSTYTISCCSPVPHIPGSTIYLLYWNLSLQCHRIWRLWKTIRSRDQALIVGICVLRDPKRLTGPPPCEGPGRESVTVKLALPGILALPACTAVSKDAFGGEPISVLCYGGSNGQRQLVPKRYQPRHANACNDPESQA